MDDPANIPNVQATLSPVLDAETALHIGLRAIEQRYGPVMTKRHQPYEATLQRGEWLVTGNPDPDGEYAKLGEEILASKREAVPRDWGGKVARWS